MKQIDTAINHTLNVLSMGRIHARAICGPLTGKDILVKSALRVIIILFMAIFCFFSTEISMSNAGEYKIPACDVVDPIKVSLCIINQESDRFGLRLRQTPISYRNEMKSSKLFVYEDKDAERSISAHHMCDNGIKSLCLDSFVGTVKYGASNTVVEYTAKGQRQGAGGMIYSEWIKIYIDASGNGSSIAHNISLLLPKYGFSINKSIFDNGGHAYGNGNYGENFIDANCKEIYRCKRFISISPGQNDLGNLSARYIKRFGREMRVTVDLNLISFKSSEEDELYYKKHPAVIAEQKRVSVTRQVDKIPSPAKSTVIGKYEILGAPKRVLSNSIEYTAQCTETNSIVVSNCRDDDGITTCSWAVGGTRKMGSEVGSYPESLMAACRAAGG